MKPKLLLPRELDSLHQLKRMLTAWKAAWLGSCHTALETGWGFRSRRIPRCYDWVGPIT